jgi:hypothetical protein
LALKGASQELVITKSKFQKTLEAHSGVEFQMILPMETKFFWGSSYRGGTSNGVLEDLQTGVCLLSNERHDWEKNVNTQSIDQKR